MTGTKSAARDTALVAGLTLVTRATGFARVMTIVAVLGVNRFSDLYQSLNLLPNYTHELLTGTLITALLVPPLVRHLDAGDIASMRRVAGGFLTVVACVATVAVLIVVGTGMFVIRALTAGVSDPTDQADLLRLGWPLLALLMPQVLFYATAAIGASVQHAAGAFAIPAIAPIAENVTIIAVLGTWAGLFGTGVQSLAGVRTNQVLFLGIGTTTAVFLHAVLQWIGAARCGVLIFPRSGWRDPEVRAIVRVALPSAGYTALNTARLVTFLVAAGLVTGGQTIFLLALNFFYLPVALSSRPLATTALPILSRLRDDKPSFVQRYLGTVGLMLFLAIPAAAFLIGMSRPVATLGLWGTGFDSETLLMLSAALATVALAVPGESLFVLSTTASYAKLDANSPLRAMVLRLGVTIALVGLIAAVRDADDNRWLILAALGLAMAAADSLAAGYLAARILEGTKGLLRTVARHLVTGVVIVSSSYLSSVAIRRAYGDSRLAAGAAVTIAGLSALGLLAVLNRYDSRNQFRTVLGGGLIKGAKSQ